MGRGQRLALMLVAAAVAAGAFLALRPGDDDGGSPAPSPTAERAPGDGETARDSQPAPPAEPEVEEVVLAGGKVRGGPARIVVEKGEPVRIDVRSDAPDEIHLHGYDVTREVAPGKPARFRLPAELEGVFEIEAHDLGHLIIAKLVVEP